MGEKKKEEKIGMSTVTQRSNHQSKSEVKKPSPEKKKVCKPFDHHPLLFQN